MNWIIENITWLFSGIGVAIVVPILGTLMRKHSAKTEKSTTSSPITITNNVMSNGGVNVDSVNNFSKSNSTNLERSQISILFIDDQKFDYVKILKKAGYQNTRRINDVHSIDCSEIVYADIIFVDINGVGTNLFPTEQGLGLAKAIKKKYASSKCVVLYSASQQPLNQEFFILDGVLNKNAVPYEFINLIESWRTK